MKPFLQTQMPPSEMRLVPELIPKTSFFKNLRSELKPGEWDTIRRAAYHRAGFKCEICGSKKTGLRCLDCHETWKYDESKRIQKLVGLISICPKCHEVKHIGLAGMRGRMAIARAHMMKVNKISEESANEAIREAFLEWERRSRMKWTLDVSELEKIKRDLFSVPSPLSEKSRERIARIVHTSMEG